MSKSKLITMGEYLIDFTAHLNGPLKDSPTFTRHPGGAPANVAVANQRLGGDSLLMTKLGNDAFGDFLIETLVNYNVRTDGVLRTNDYQTSLAFVSVKDNGERDFTFFRANASDLNFKPSEVRENYFAAGDIFHFCSVSLVPSLTKSAHEQALKYAEKHQLIVSFDPNLRIPLWDNVENLVSTVWEFVPRADIVKISDDELFILSGKKNIKQALPQFFCGNVAVVLYTKGPNGAEVFLKDGTHYSAPTYATNVLDTTGAGDAFIGGFLHCLLRDKVTKEQLYAGNFRAEEYLVFASKVAAYVTERYGAINALPTLKDLGFNE